MHISRDHNGVSHDHYTTIELLNTYESVAFWWAHGSRSGTNIQQGVEEEPFLGNIDVKSLYAPPTCSN